MKAQREEKQMTAENFATTDDYKNDPLYKLVEQAEQAETIRLGYNGESQELPEDFRF